MSRQRPELDLKAEQLLAFQRLLKRFQGDGEKLALHLYAENFALRQRIRELSPYQERD